MRREWEKRLKWAEIVVRQSTRLMVRCHAIVFRCHPWITPLSLTSYRSLAALPPTLRSLFQWQMSFRAQERASSCRNVMQPICKLWKLESADWWPRCTLWTPDNLYSWLSAPAVTSPYSRSCSRMIAADVVVYETRVFPLVPSSVDFVNIKMFHDRNLDH